MDTFYIIMADDHETRYEEGFDYRFKRFEGPEAEKQATHAAESLAKRYHKKFHVLKQIRSIRYVDNTETGGAT